MRERPQTNLRGSLPTSGRRPKTADTRRRCNSDGCDTVLSQYNLNDTCRVHSPIRFPRVRGHMPAEA